VYLAQPLTEENLPWRTVTLAIDADTRQSATLEFQVVGGASLVKEASLIPETAALDGDDILLPIGSIPNDEGGRGRGGGYRIDVIAGGNIRSCRPLSPASLRALADETTDGDLRTQLYSAAQWPVVRVSREEAALNPELRVTIPFLTPPVRRIHRGAWPRPVGITDFAVPDTPEVVTEVARGHQPEFVALMCRIRADALSVGDEATDDEALLVLRDRVPQFVERLRQMKAIEVRPPQGWLTRSLQWLESHARRVGATLPPRQPSVVDIANSLETWVSEDGDLATLRRLVDDLGALRLTVGWEAGTQGRDAAKAGRPTNTINEEDARHLLRAASDIVSFERAAIAFSQVKTAGWIAFAGVILLGLVQLTVAITLHDGHLWSLQPAEVWTSRALEDHRQPLVSLLLVFPPLMFVDIFRNRPRTAIERLASQPYLIVLTGAVALPIIPLVGAVGRVPSHLVGLGLIGSGLTAITIGGYAAFMSRASRITLASRRLVKRVAGAPWWA